MNKEKIVQVVYDAIDTLNKQLSEENQLTKSEDTVLFGEMGKLDSMGLVSLIITVEEYINDEFGKSITIANEKALSLQNSPFLTVQTLVDYTLSILTKDDDE